MPCRVNGVLSYALLDTGAEAAIISDDIYHRINTNASKLEPPRKPVLGANNLLDVVGETELTLKLGSIKAQHKVLVCRGLPQQVLIGIDFLMTHKCIINFDNNTVYNEVNSMVSGPLDKVYRITVAETVTLSPNMVADIPCVIEGVSGHKECVGVVEPGSKFSERYSFGVLRTAVTVKDGRIPVRVFNCLNKPLKNYRCSSVGDLHPLVDGFDLPDKGASEGYKVVKGAKEHVKVELGARQCSAGFVENSEADNVPFEEMFPISSDSVPEEEKRKHYEVLSTYADCISRGPWDLGSAKGVKHTIDTGSARPIQVPPRRVPFHKRQEMRRQVEEMLEAQIIEPSESPWSFPVVLVAKPDGTQRSCVDDRALNKVTKRDLYPLPRCDDILESVAGAQWFSHLDLLRGYWQIDVVEEDREKTAFATPDGLYQFRTLSFGLTNAPACFMRAMHLVLKGLCWSDCLVYLDDIIVFGRTLQGHRERLSLVLSRLSEAGLKINPKKCKLLSERVIVLGHVVTRDGISTDPEKVRVIKEWPVLEDESQLKAFLGTASYYRQFVPNYATIAAPLHRASQKGERFRWTVQCEEAFASIKRKLTNAPILAFPQLDEPFILDTDASDRGLGAVLSQVQGGNERVIAYAAGALSNAEGNYSTTRKELVTLVWGAGLSRLTWESINSAEQDEDAVLINSVNVEPLSRESIKVALKQDPILSQVVDWLETGVKPARCDVEGGGRKLRS